MQDQILAARSETPSSLTCVSDDTTSLSSQTSLTTPLDSDDESDEGFAANIITQCRPEAEQILREETLLDKCLLCRYAKPLAPEMVLDILSSIPGQERSKILDLEDQVEPQHAKGLTEPIEIVNTNPISMAKDINDQSDNHSKAITFCSILEWLGNGGKVATPMDKYLLWHYELREWFKSLVDTGWKAIVAEAVRRVNTFAHMALVGEGELEFPFFVHPIKALIDDCSEGLMKRLKELRLLELHFEGFKNGGGSLAIFSTGSGLYHSLTRWQPSELAQAFTVADENSLSHESEATIIKNSRQLSLDIQCCTDRYVNLTQKLYEFAKELDMRKNYCSLIPVVVGLLRADKIELDFSLWKLGKADNDFEAYRDRYNATGGLHFANFVREAFVRDMHPSTKI